MRFPFLSAVFSALFLSAGVNAVAPAPKGFDEPGLIDQLRKGKIIQKDLVSTTKEIRVLYKSFFKGITTDDYLAKIIEQDSYDRFLSNMKESKRLKSYSAGKHYQYTVKICLAFLDSDIFSRESKHHAPLHFGWLAA